MQFPYYLLWWLSTEEASSSRWFGQAKHIWLQVNVKYIFVSLIRSALLPCFIWQHIQSVLQLHLSAEHILISCHTYSANILAFIPSIILVINVFVFFCLKSRRTPLDVTSKFLYMIWTPEEENIIGEICGKKKKKSTKNKKQNKKAFKNIETKQLKI